MHDQNVENMAKKLRRARAAPKKQQKQKNVKGKNNKATNINQNAKKKGDENGLFITIDYEIHQACRI